MKFLLLFLLLLPVAGFTQNYPETKKEPLTLTRHNITYNDDYAWLEDMRGEEVNNWVDSQNKLYNSHINGLSASVYPLPLLTKYSNQTSYRLPHKKRTYYYSLVRYYGKEVQTPSLAYRKNINGNNIMLVNPNFFYNGKTVNIIDYSPSINSEILAYKLMIDGSDQYEIRFTTIKSGRKYDDVIKNAKFGNIAWKGDEGIFYKKNSNTSQFALDSTYHVYYHKLGTDVKNDGLVFDVSGIEGQVSTFTSYDGTKLFIGAFDKTESIADYYYADLTKEKFELVKFLDNARVNFDMIGYYDNKFYIDSRQSNWGDVEYFDLENPSIKKVVVPQYQNQLLVGSYLFKDRILCKYKNTDGNYFMLFDRNGKFIKKIQTPKGMDVVLSSYDYADTEAIFYVTSHTIPPILFTLNLEDGAYDRFVNPTYAKTTAPFPPEYFVTNTTTYTSRDGVEVPITIIHKKDIVLDGTNPTLLEAYGGFGTVTQPSYDVGLIYFLSNGGVYAYAEVRGGGEKGRKWHTEGTALKKINTINDFIDAAEFLISQKYTSPDRLGITGGSQGGLLVGAAMVKRPDLFKVAIPKVGVYDMAKFNNYTVARFHLDEYGDPDVEEEFTAMMDYSPYHNIKEDVNYPATLIITSDNDDRVPPVHSYKFAAKLQNRAAQINPVYLKTRRNAGHYGVTTNNEEHLQEESEVYSFLLYYLKK
ncbi:prolyl oligopeptidase family serine peptidase [Flavobacterium sp. MK4S-17]|uniref:prolyl oligopeptidase family serine peptidase n=1 Tax=Flavobacterium sp. MK4S-17 TaxID=2543737 RepID=UPI0013581A08|nr:prolyl oligopeptidase family serine peptidase [Flavobacterium sp. MK4S-17]